ncbi:MAG TPA: carboxypeptidase-like regulatory domain-containing protein [Terriglobia bacterium]|nr:carboxypeptidase-like regulatory domain-containing protein [Terriglobia bacterium]
MGTIRKIYGGPSLLRLGATMFAFLFSVQILCAQYENGSLVGTIRDASGATIPQATVTITNTAAGIMSQAKTDSAGNYDVPELRAGVYCVQRLQPHQSLSAEQPDRDPGSGSYGGWNCLHYFHAASDPVRAES